MVGRSKCLRAPSPGFTNLWIHTMGFACRGMRYQLVTAVHQMGDRHLGHTFQRGDPGPWNP